MSQQLPQSHFCSFFPSVPPFSHLSLPHADMFHWHSPSINQMPSDFSPFTPVPATPISPAIIRLTWAAPPISQSAPIPSSASHIPAQIHCSTASSLKLPCASCLCLLACHLLSETCYLKSCTWTLLPACFGTLPDVFWTLDFLSSPLELLSVWTAFPVLPASCFLQLLYSILVIKLLNCSCLHLGPIPCSSKLNTLNN